MIEYEERKSAVHSAPAEFKILLTLAITLLAILFNQTTPLAMLYAATIVLFFAAKLTHKSIDLGASGWAFVILVTLLQYIVTPAITMEKALAITFRLLALLNTGRLLAMTTTPQETVNGLRKLFVPPTICFVIATAIRFLPILTHEMSEVKQAQQARGLKTNSLNPLKRVNAYLTLLVPLFALSLERAEHLALALEYRGFSKKALEKIRPDGTAPRV